MLPTSRDDHEIDRSVWCGAREDHLTIEDHANGELSVELFPKELPKTNPVMLRYDEHPRCVKNREEPANRAIHRL
jgi:hypothetical protein